MMVPVLARKRPASGTIQWSTVANQTPPGPYYFSHFYGLTAFYLRPVSITKAELHTLSMLRQQAGALHKTWPLSPPNIAGLPGTVHFCLQCSMDGYLKLLLLLPSSLVSSDWEAVM